MRALMENGLNHVRQFPFSDILGWSVSRYDKFQLCKRQYYYDYYGKFDREYPRSKIQSLKQMSSVPLETGNIVHDTLKTLLERLLVAEGPVDEARFLEYARRKTQEYCSARTFAEVYYGDRTRVDAEAVFGDVRTSLENFLASERYRWITAKALANKTGWVIEPPGYGETRIDGMKAYCKVDFLFPVEGLIHILDWKTGRQDERKHRKQLLGYALWASYHVARDPAVIRPAIAYLQPAYREMAITFNEFDLREFAARVRAETGEMHAYCQDAERNIPLGKERFSPTANRAVCPFCNYRELC